MGRTTGAPACPQPPPSPDLSQIAPDGEKDVEDDHGDHHRPEPANRDVAANPEVQAGPEEAEPRLDLSRMMFYLCSIMQPPAASPYSAADLAIIEAMTKGAFEMAEITLGLAKAATGDVRTFLALSTEYRHLSYAVRMCLRLKLEPPKASRVLMDAGEKPERDDTVLRPDFLERPERPDYERERERERYEPVSLDLLLKRLRGSVTRIERMGDVFPAQVRETTLPNLKRLLAQAGAPAAQKPMAQPRPPPKVTPSGTLALLTRPPPTPATRAHLLGSTGAIRPPPRPGPS